MSTQPILSRNLDRRDYAIGNMRAPYRSFLSGERCRDCGCKLSQRRTVERGYCYACAPNGSMSGDRVIGRGDMA